MTVTEALKICRAAPPEGREFSVMLACGFTPVHLQTFLAAHLQKLLPDRRVKIVTGLYGDLPGTLETLSTQAPLTLAVAMEWTDLDPRLGFREQGAWGPAAVTDVVESARVQLDRMAAAMEALPPGTQAAISLPGLPLPPLFHTTGAQAGLAELALEQSVAAAAVRFAAARGVSVVHARALAEESPQSARYDFKSDLITGLPYSVAHADAVASALAKLLAPAPPKKGLITDLDDTMWNGIVGEVGPDSVSWDLSSHQQIHGLYQKLLAALAAEGVLVAVASKNDADVVQRVFDREDILLPRARVFPWEAHWNAKSGSVSRILQAWNIGSDSVVFIDDSPLELAEVAAAHPGIECIRFPKGDYPAIYAMLRRLRDLFGKPRVSEEDALRLESIRAGAALQEAGTDAASSEKFLSQLDAVVTFDLRRNAADPRALELVNKTNQFNLNGVRHTEPDWSSRLTQPETVLAVIGYQDKFGPLGKIGVIRGNREGGTLVVDTWVMSCRAFARRIEHQTLKMLFSQSDVDEIGFEFQETAKNGPLRSFFQSMTGRMPDAPFVVSREQFEKGSPALYQKLQYVTE